MQRVLVGFFAASLLIASCSRNVEQEATGESLAVAAANLPDTDILMGVLTQNGDNPFAVAGIVNVADEAGYQNQPYFIGAGQGQFYYVSEGASGKTDIWAYDFYTDESVQLTDTPTMSEYSPKAAPGDQLSFIQESEDGEVTRVHVLRGISEAGAPAIELAPLGYYEWLNSGAQLAVFYRSEPSTLYLVDVESGVRREIFKNVGRSFQASPDGAHLYVTQAEDEGRHRIMKVDAETGAAVAILALPGAAQDFWLMFDAAGDANVVFSADGPKLLWRRLGAETDWRVSADVSGLGYGDVTRIAVRPGAVAGDAAAAQTGPGPIVFVARREAN